MDAYVLLRSLQSKAQELERQRATDSLKKGLGKRPEREELIERKCSNADPISEKSKMLIVE